jgi:hypothetical protein
MDGILFSARSAARRISVAPVRDRRGLDRIHRLVHDAYVRSNYISPQPRGRLIYCPHLDSIPETTVLVAEGGGAILGTSTLTLDGPAGFHCEHEYPEAVAAIRRENRPLASLWRLALEAPAGDRVATLLALIRANQRLIRARGVQTCLFALVAHFEPLYRRLLNARRVAAKPPGHGCVSAPLAMFRCETVLMRWDAERCPMRWLSCPSTPMERISHVCPV